MHTTKQAVPVECLDWWLFTLIHSLGQLSHFCLNGWTANPETPKMAQPYFQSWIRWQILNRKAQIPIRVSQTIRLSRLVSEIFARDRRTDRQVCTITIAVPHIAANQLINRIELHPAFGAFCIIRTRKQASIFYSYQDPQSATCPNQKTYHITFYREFVVHPLQENLDHRCITKIG